MPALLLTLLPLLGKVAPALMTLAFQGHAPAVVGKVEAALQDLFGTTDPTAVLAAADADPSKVDALKARLDADTAQLQVTLVDVQSARAAQGRLIEAKSSLQYVPAAWTVMVAVGFLAMMTVLVLHPVELTTNQVSVLNILFGVLTAEFARCGSFWLGTSSSAIKRGDQALDAAYQAAPSGSRRMS